jgi:glycogen synthase
MTLGELTLNGAPAHRLYTGARHPRLRLLLINYELPPIGGGAGHATYHTALALAERGHQVDILTSRYGETTSYERVGDVGIHRVLSLRRGIHKCGLLGAATFLARAAPALPSLLRARRPELCHYYFSLPTGLLSLYSHGLRGLPYLVSLRGSDVPAYDRTKAEVQVLHRLLGGVNRHIWNRASAVVALSESLRSQALEADPSVDIDVISNGIDIEKFSPPRSPRPERKSVRLVCVCRLVPRKGVDVLLEAMALLRQEPVTLEIIGTGELEETLRERARALGVHRRVHFKGYVAQDELGAHYRRADAFVLPSLAESFGMVLLEAMSCGLPVVASRTGGIPETVTDGENGLLVPAGDPRELAAALRRLVNDRELRLEIGENNVRKVRARYTWAKVAEQYEHTYRHVLESARAEGRCLSD